MFSLADSNPYQAPLASGTEESLFRLPFWHYWLLMTAIIWAMNMTGAYVGDPIAIFVVYRTTGYLMIRDADLPAIFAAVSVWESVFLAAYIGLYAVYKADDRGVSGFDFWGRRVLMPWNLIDEVHHRRFLTLRYLRIRGAGVARAVYWPIEIARDCRFRELVNLHAPSTGPLTQVLEKCYGAVEPAVEPKGVDVHP